MNLGELVAWFALASVAGWLFESVYSVIRTGHWEKRGFLFGPLCPIYGFGVVVALLLFDRPEVTSGSWPGWFVFLSCMVGSAVLEYVVSVVLERLFGAVWWDYSDMPLNVNGRICLPASLLFGVAGVAVVYVVAPALHVVSAAVPAVVFEAVSLVLAFALGIDSAASVLSLTDLMKTITSLSDEANLRADARVQQVGDALRSLPARAKEGGAHARATFSVSQEKMRLAVGGLTKRQVKLLSQLRRFSSHDARESAMALLDAIRKSNGDANNGRADNARGCGEGKGGENDKAFGFGGSDENSCGKGDVEARDGGAGGHDGGNGK